MEKSNSKRALLFHKGANFKISKNFSSYEFECPCVWEDCRSVILTDDVVSSLQSTRDDFKAPVIVSSGNRCVRRNQIVGGAENSSHTWGDGVDLTCDDVEELNFLESCAKRHFKFVLRYEHHIHCDNRLHKS